jgi:hypothetical protein
LIAGAATPKADLFIGPSVITTKTPSVIVKKTMTCLDRSINELRRAGGDDESAPVVIRIDRNVFMELLR